MNESNEKQELPSWHRKSQKAYRVNRIIIIYRIKRFIFFEFIKIFRIIIIF